MVPRLKIETPIEIVAQAKQAVGPSRYLFGGQLPILEVSLNSN